MVIVECGNVDTLNGYGLLFCNRPPLEVIETDR